MKLPVGTHIGYVHLRVADLDRALAFYGDKLGFRIREKTPEGVALSATGELPDLIRLRAHPGALKRPHRSTGLYHVAIRLPNRRELARSLARLIQTRASAQGFADHGVSEAVYLADPEGNGIELYTDRPQEDWPRTEDQIAMVSEPLDLDGLLSLADSAAPWEGIAPETDIGHVHLQVSDLGKAEEFYHKQLGFDVTQRSYPGALFFAAGGYHHHIGTNVWAGRNVPPPPANSTGLIEFSIVAPDAAVWAGVPNATEGASNRVVRDPDGIAIVLAGSNTATV